MMTLEQMLTEIRADCQRDVAKREGQPLTGPNVAEWLGEIQALIHALAGVNLRLLERIKALEAAADVSGYLDEQEDDG